MDILDIFFWIFSVYYRKLKLLIIKKIIVPICIHLHKETTGGVIKIYPILTTYRLFAELYYKYTLHFIKVTKAIVL